MFYTGDGENCMKENVTKDNVVATEKKTVTNKNVLVAKILIVIILLITGTVGAFALIDYLNKPKTLFYSALNDTYNDFSTIMDAVGNDKLYSLLNKKAVEIDADTKLNISNMKAEDEEYQNFLNSLSYISTTKFDKTNKYLSNEIKIKNNVNEIYNITYVDENFTNYINITNLYDRFVLLPTDEINLEQLDPTKNIYLGDTIKGEFLKVLSDENFESTTKTIAVNSKTVDCKVSTYTLNGLEMNTLLDNIINSIENNSNNLYYLADLYGISASSVKNKLTELKDTLLLDEETSYTFSAYTKMDTDETVQFSLSFKTLLNGERVDKTISYSRGVDYKLLEISENGQSEYIKITGNISDKAEIVMHSSDAELDFTTNLKDNSNEGNITLTLSDSDISSISGTYSYVITDSSSDTASMSLTMDLNIMTSDSSFDTEINSSILINSGIKVDKEEITDYVNLDEIGEQDLSSILKNLESHLNELSKENIEQSANQ